jgi:hypothetical protein
MSEVLRRALAHEEWITRVASQSATRAASEARWKSEAERASLEAAIARGLHGSISASPDLFAPYVFSVADASALLAAWLLGQPRREY